VNIDGQVRFSHIVAHGTATPDQDIRAVGALLYLMLTGTWPLPEPPPVSAPAGQAPTTVPQATTRVGRELPADEINPAVPEALSALAGRALHPEEPDGIHAIGAVAALLRKPQAVAPESPPPPAQQLRLTADRRLINERRMKLSLAAVILAVFAMLIVIAVGGLANQFLASVDNSAPSNVQMIDAGTSPSAQPAGPAASPNAAGTNGQSTAGTTPAVATVPIVDGTVYDPQGDGKPDYKSYVDRAYDGNPDSAWLTWVYKQQFPSLKTGVGLMLQLQQQTTPSSVQISSSTPGTTVEIRSATGPTTTLDQTSVLGSGTITDQPLTITLTNPPKSNYILVFVTRMAKTGDNQYQSKINEIAVAGN
jgi:putative peptidoglycan lipid II flippase